VRIHGFFWRRHLDVLGLKCPMAPVQLVIAIRHE
jgi:hypothetical protein